MAIGGQSGVGSSVFATSARETAADHGWAQQSTGGTGEDPIVGVLGGRPLVHVLPKDARVILSSSITRSASVFGRVR